LPLFIPIERLGDGANVGHFDVGPQATNGSDLPCEIRTPMIRDSRTDAKELMGEFGLRLKTPLC
jgi:hypothetical protein